uniref:YraN family protein n=1 Tax=Ningiella ruwaisensis TaxID=2364274 RepID=UPI001F4FFEF2|nr:YraN family protein [Ningiella ruwaisensis]
MAIVQWKATSTGAAAEQQAKAYLIDNGLRFIEQNYKANVGEIDLIFKDAQQWVFVEVKYRESDSHGFAAEMFSQSKRSKFVRAIMCYLQAHELNCHHTPMRIDLIAIDDKTLNWIKNV